MLKHSNFSKEDRVIDWSDFEGFMSDIDHYTYYVDNKKGVKILLGPTFDYSKWQKHDLRAFDEEAYEKMYGKDK